MAVGVLWTFQFLSISLLTRILLLRLFGGVTLTLFTIRRPPAEIFGAPTKYNIFTVSLKNKKKVATIFRFFL